MEKISGETSQETMQKSRKEGEGWMHQHQLSGASQLDAESKKKLTSKFADGQVGPKYMHFRWYNGNGNVQGETGMNGPLFFLLQPSPYSTHMGTLF